MEFDTIDRERSMRRLELGSRNREESCRVRAYQLAQREAVQADQTALKYFEQREVIESLESRRLRWRKNFEFLR